MFPPSSGTGKALCLKGVARCPGLSRSRPIPPLTLTQAHCCDRSPGGVQTLTSYRLSLRAREVHSSSPGGVPAYKSGQGPRALRNPALGKRKRRNSGFWLPLTCTPRCSLPACVRAQRESPGCSFGQTGFLNHRQLDSGNLLSVILNTLTNVCSDTEAGFQERSRRRLLLLLYWIPGT